MELLSFPLPKKGVRIDGAERNPPRHMQWRKFGSDWCVGKREFYTRLVQQGPYGQGHGGTPWRSPFVDDPKGDGIKCRSEVPCHAM